MDEEKPTETLLDKRAIRQRKQREYYAPTGGPGGAARAAKNSVLTSGVKQLKC